MTVIPLGPSYIWIFVLAQNNTKLMQITTKIEEVESRNQNLRWDLNLTILFHYNKNNLLQ